MISERVRKIITLEAQDNRMELAQPSETLEALGFDSLGRHTLSIALEDEFKIDIECGTEDAWKTVQDVIDSISNEMAGSIQAGDKITMSGDNRTFEVVTNKSDGIKGIVDFIKNIAGLKPEQVVILTDDLPEFIASQKCEMTIQFEKTFGIKLDNRLEWCRTYQDVIDVVTNQIYAKATGPGSFYDQNGGRFKGQNHMTPEEEKLYLNSMYPPTAHNAAIEYYDAKRAGRITADGQAVINRITREDVDACRGYVTRHNALDRYQTIATKSAIYPGQGTPLGLAYVALKLNGEAGEFAEHVGKAMRDDGLVTFDVTVPGADGRAHAAVNFNPLSEERKRQIIKEIGDVLWYLSAACNELGTTLSEAALTNLEKLCDRTERDALRGSGDER